MAAGAACGTTGAAFAAGGAVTGLPDKKASSGSPDAATGADGATVAGADGCAVGCVVGCALLAGARDISLDRPAMSASNRIFCFGSLVFVSAACALLSSACKIDKESLSRWACTSDATRVDSAGFFGGCATACPPKNCSSTSFIY